MFTERERTLKSFLLLARITGDDGWVHSPYAARSIIVHTAWLTIHLYHPSGRHVIWWNRPNLCLGGYCMQFRRRELPWADTIIALILTAKNRPFWFLFHANGPAKCCVFLILPGIITGYFLAHAVLSFLFLLHKP